MKAAQILKQKINSPSPTVGAMSTYRIWPEMVEMAQRAGLDYLILDFEHLTHPSEVAAQICMIGRMTDFPILIRPPSHEPTTIRLMMDLGPCGLLVPSVQSIADLERVQQGIYMPPRGQRRPGGPGNFWVSDFHYHTWKTQVEDDLIILPQIETRLGLEHAQAIAQHPLTTAIAVGPYDLSADLGLCWQPQHPECQAAIQRIRQAGLQAGKNMWMIGPAAALKQEGFTFLCLGELTAILEAALKGQVAQVKDP